MAGRLSDRSIDDLAKGFAKLMKDLQDMEPYHYPPPTNQPSVDELGCSYSIVTGEHYGECKGTCGIVPTGIDSSPAEAEPFEPSKEQDDWAATAYQLFPDKWETLLTIPAPFGRILLQRRE